MRNGFRCVPADLYPLIEIEFQFNGGDVGCVGSDWIFRDDGKAYMHPVVPAKSRW